MFFPTDRLCPSRGDAVGFDRLSDMETRHVNSRNLQLEVVVSAMSGSDFAVARTGSTLLSKRVHGADPGRGLGMRDVEADPVAEAGGWSKVGAERG